MAQQTERYCTLCKGNLQKCKWNMPHKILDSRTVHGSADRALCAMYCAVYQ